MRVDRRRAFTLIEMVMLLPLLGGVTYVGYQLINRVTLVQSYERRAMANDSKVRHLVRRIQADAAWAASVTVYRGDDCVALELANDVRDVTYGVSAGQVTRIERVGDGPEVRYGWTLDDVEVDFEFEALDSTPGVVWVLFSAVLPVDCGRDFERKLATAATVGRGGGL